jgi:hypothetical protein
MNAPDPMGARSRFLREIDAAPRRPDETARLCTACVRALPVTHAGIAVHIEGIGLEVLCASDPVADRIEWIQVTLGEGPGLDAVRQGKPVLVTDLAASRDTWPIFAPDAAHTGVGAMYSLPLQLGAIRVGVLDLYRDTPGELDASEFVDAAAVADVITAVLLTVGRSGSLAASLGVWWDQTLRTREVHQATGMVVAQLGVSARTAYVRMQAFAYERDRLLTDVAHDIVHRRLRLDRDADPSPQLE